MCVRLKTVKRDRFEIKNKSNVGRYEKIFSFGIFFYVNFSLN